MEYKRGELVIDKSYFEKEIKNDPFIIQIILSMISPNPSDRKTIDQYLHLFLSESIDSSSKSFPESFNEILYPIGKAFLQPEFLFGDEKIAMIYETTSWPTSNLECKPFALNPIIFQKIKKAQVFRIGKAKNNRGSDLSPVEEEKYEDSKVAKDCDGEGLILFNMIIHAIPQCQFPSSKILAMELIKKISDD